MIIFGSGVRRVTPPGTAKERGGVSPNGVNPFVGEWCLTWLDGRVYAGGLHWTFTESELRIESKSRVVTGSYDVHPDGKAHTLDLHLRGQESNRVMYGFVSKTHLVISIRGGRRQRAMHLEIQPRQDVRPIDRTG